MDFNALSAKRKRVDKLGRVRPQKYRNHKFSTYENGNGGKQFRDGTQVLVATEDTDDSPSANMDDDEALPESAMIDHADGSSSATLATDGSSSATLPTDGSSSVTLATDGSSSATLASDGSSSVTLASDGSSSATLASDGSSSATLATDGSSSATLATDGSSSVTLATDGSSSATLASDGSSSVTLATDGSSFVRLASDGSSSATLADNEKENFTMDALNEYINHHQADDMFDDAPDYMCDNDYMDNLNVPEEYYDCYEGYDNIDQENIAGECGDDDEKTSEEEEKEFGSEPIYPGHSLPIKISVLLIWMYAVKYAISGVQFADLLELLNIHFAYSHPALRSMYQFKTFFSRIQAPVQISKHFYCRYCLSPVRHDTVICTNSFCLKDLSVERVKSYFVEVPVFEQLRTMFVQKDFAASVKSRFKRIKKNRDSIEDIYDGLLYKELSKNGGPLSEEHPYNLSFTLNTDGVPIFKSSKMAIWPIFLMINELPYKMRKQKKNMLLAGLWFGESKPFMPTFTEPLHKSLLTLENEGINIELDQGAVQVNAFHLCLTADLPARSTICNMIQFNGDTSCPHCLQRGANFRTDRGGNVHVFPFQPDNPTGPERSHQGCINDAYTAFNNTNQKACNGLKGPSFLLGLKYFNAVKSISIDPIHCCFLGITKLLTRLWFDASHAKMPFSISSAVNLVDSRMKEIKVTRQIIRVPRTISEHIKHWKAAEYRSWLFFYSVPILSDILKPIYLYHYLAYVEAIYTLSKDSVSEQELEHCQMLLGYFVFMFKELYGSRFQTQNMHLLLHLPECVKQLGPLFVFSCFPFENANGDLLKMFHGTQYVDMQIASAVHLYQILPTVCDLVPPKSSAHNFVSRLSKTHRNDNVSMQSFFSW